eukprot:Hpha_TRINITY_DN3914_c0_g1::TRINITY_DN3914_c0_g1_i1::g.18025::m.18025
MSSGALQLARVVSELRAAVSLGDGVAVRRYLRLRPELFRSHSLDGTGLLAWCCSDPSPTYAVPLTELVCDEWRRSKTVHCGTSAAFSAARGRGGELGEALLAALEQGGVVEGDEGFEGKEGSRYWTERAVVWIAATPGARVSSQAVEEAVAAADPGRDEGSVRLRGMKGEVCYEGGMSRGRRRGHGDQLWG